MGNVYALDVVPVAPRPVEVEALDGDPRRVEVADPSPDGGLPLDGAYVFSAGRPIVPGYMPTRMQWRGAVAAMPDFDDHLVLNVSGRVRGLIEALEPGVHQFLPVTCLGDENRRLEQRHFLIVGNRIDSVNRDRTTLLLWHDTIWQPARLLPPEEVPAGFDASVEPRLVFDLRRIGRAHLWRDKHLRQGPFLSEALADALRESGMTGLNLEGNAFEAV